VSSESQSHQQDHVRPRVLPELLQVLPLLQPEHEMHEPCAVRSQAFRQHYGQGAQAYLFLSIKEGGSLRTASGLVSARIDEVLAIQTPRQAQHSHTGSRPHNVMLTG